MKYLHFVIATLLMMSAVVEASNESQNPNASKGTISVPSANSFDDTISKLSSTLKEKGMKVFATIPHSTGAASVGVDINPTTLVIFGNPKVGAPLMACAQQVGIDLPQKALITEVSSGAVSLTYNDPMYLKERHAIKGCDPVLEKVAQALDKFAKAATE